MINKISNFQSMPSKNQTKNPSFGYAYYAKKVTPFNPVYLETKLNAHQETKALLDLIKKVASGKFKLSNEEMPKHTNIFKNKNSETITQQLEHDLDYPQIKYSDKTGNESITIIKHKQVEYDNPGEKDIIYSIFDTLVELLEKLAPKK